MAAENETSSWRVRPGLSPVPMSFASVNIRECAFESDAPAPGAPLGSVPRATSPVAFFVESGFATLAVDVPSQPARAMLAAKNNRSHLEIAPCVQICAVLRMLSDMDPRCSGRLQSRPAWAPSTRCKGNQLVKALGAAHPSTRARFHHGRAGGHFEYEKSRPRRSASGRSGRKEIKHFNYVSRQKPLSLTNQLLGAARA